jgi:hypothetical protein
MCNETAADGNNVSHFVKNPSVSRALPDINEICIARFDSTQQALHSGFSHFRSLFQEEDYFKFAKL